MLRGDSAFGFMGAIIGQSTNLNAVERKVGPYRDQSTGVRSPTSMGLKSLSSHCSLGEGLMDHHRVTLCPLAKTFVSFVLPALDIHDHNELYPYNEQVGIAQSPDH